MSMLAQNVINPEKKGKIQGRVFHLFYPDLNTSYLFDRDLMTPIIWGSKNVVMAQLKRIDELMDTPRTEKIYVYSYVLAQEGFRRIQTYSGPIENIGRYIIRY